MGALGANLAVAAAVLLAGLSLLLAFVAGSALRRIGHGRFLWLTVAFLAFAAKGGWLVWALYEARGDVAAGWNGLATLAVVDLGIVLALYLAVLKD